MASDHVCVDCLALPVRPEGGEVAEGECRPRAPRPTDVAVHPRSPRCATHRRAFQRAQKARSAAGAASRRYLVTPEDLRAYRAAHGSACRVCGHVTGRRGRHHDHDHRTGEFRGLLCSICNVYIGRIGDSINVAECLAEYLRNPPARSVLAPRDWSDARGRR